jgi:cobaltochelatase CobT
MSWVEFSEKAVHQHTDASNREAGLHIEYPAGTENNMNWIPLPIEHFNVDMPFPNPITDGNIARKLDKCFSEQFLTKKIRRELQSVTRTRWHNNQRRGKIHKRALASVPVNQNAKVMKRRVTNFSPKSTCVMLLQDWSGSMGSGKYIHASTATHELARVLHGLQVPTGIYGFSTHSRRKNLLFEMKSFKETFNSTKFRDRCVIASHHMHSNADGDYLLWAGEQLRKQKAQRRILFVLSDGSPAATDMHRNHNCFGFTKRVARELEEKGGIEVYAIGIEDANVRRIYRDNCVLSQASELEAKLLNVLRNKIINHLS